MPRLTLLALLVASPLSAADWLQFRGPNGSGVNTETGLPLKWSATENVIWKVKLPRPRHVQPDLTLRQPLPDRVQRLQRAGQAEGRAGEAGSASCSTRLKSGVPPHGGIALGLDRWCMILAGTTNIRDVIAFPKNKQARDLMTGAPATVDARQFRDLGIKTS